MTPEDWAKVAVRVAMLEAALHPAVAVGPDDQKLCQGHLVWWPDELPTPLFLGRIGERRLFDAGSAWSVHGRGGDMAASSASRRPYVGIIPSTQNQDGRVT